MTADWIYTNRVPFGLLTDAERAELQAHPGPWESYDIWGSGSWTSNASPLWIGPAFYRAARPQPQHAQPPWDILDPSIVAVSVGISGDWLAHTKEPHCQNSIWWAPDGINYEITALIFPRGNMPWSESLVLRPGYEVGK